MTHLLHRGVTLSNSFTFDHLKLLVTRPPQMTRKTLLLTWSKLYKVFARCSALVPTAEENVCCEELCARMSVAVNAEALAVSIVGGANEGSHSDVCG